MTDATLMSTPADAPAFADGAHARPALPGADERVTQDKHRREAAWRTAVAEAIGQAARGPAGEAPEFRAELVRRVAIMLWHEMANDLRVRIVKLLGWPPLKARWDTGPGLTAAEHIGSLAGGELARYLAVALVASQTHIATYQGITKPTELLDMADLLGVDVQACKDSVRELAKRTPDAAAAKRAAAKAAELTPETALAAAVKRGRSATRRITYHRAEQDKPAGDQTVVCWLRTGQWYAGWWAAEGGQWFDAATGGALEGVVRWGEPPSPLPKPSPLFNDKGKRAAEGGPLDPPVVPL